MAAETRAREPRIDLSRYELIVAGRPIKLERQPMELLIFFAQRSGQLVTREDIVEKLWGKGVFVDADSSINAAVRKIRSALKDDPARPRFLETVVGKGYRIIAPIALIGAPQKETSSLRSLVVLPLENLSGSSEHDYIADGMTDAITTSLAQVSALRVISRTSAVQYRGARKPTPQIARELNVDALVEGSVLLSGRSIQIHVQLIDARRDRHLWAKSFEGQLGDLITVQNQVAHHVAMHIQGHLSPADQKRLTRTQPVNPEAHENYLMGRYCWHKWTEGGIRKSIEYYEKALRIAPDYARAYAGLADSYNALSALVIAAMEPIEALSKSKQAALRALELDDGLVEAHSALGAALLFYDWDWAGAERELRRAITLNPNYATARHWYSCYLLVQKRYDESLGESLLARELSPLGVEMMVHISWHYFLAHDFDQSQYAARKAVEMAPDQAEGHLMLGLPLVQKCEYEHAIKELKKAVELSAGRPIIWSALGNAYACAGQKSEAESILKLLATRTPIPNYEMAAIYSGLGDSDAAFPLLQAALDARASAVLFLPNDPCMDPLRADPRFRDLVRRVGFPE